MSSIDKDLKRAETLVNEGKDFEAIPILNEMVEKPRLSLFLVFTSPHIINSEMVKKEISFALKKNKPFFAVYLKETNLPSELEFEIADIQAMMKYLMPKSEFFLKLKNLIINSLNI